jgi:hypothetical protein
MPAQAAASSLLRNPPLASLPLRSRSGNVLELLEDIQELRPTIFSSVPRLWNRIYDKVMAQVRGWVGVGVWVGGGGRETGRGQGVYKWQKERSALAGWLVICSGGRNG